MEKEINIIELFSGIGGFSKGISEAGFKIKNHYFSDIDKHAIANYKYNFPNAKFIGDVKSVQSGDFNGIDIITFGSPCQDFSLAGKRKGLEGQRSSLIEYAIKLVADIRPSVFIWENVKGTFSSNAGADFWAILQAFANIGDYRLEWQLLNTKWFLPQNRERIYLVGHLNGRSRPAVFPIGENDFLFKGSDSAKKGQSQAKYSTTIGAAGMRASDTYIDVKIGGIRGRNPENTSSRKVGQNTVQILEINNNDVSNTITSVQKDNVVVGTWRTHKDGNGFRKTSDNNSPTIPARARQDGSGQPVIKTDSFIRRLTEIECERLQGFPDNWTKFGNYDGAIKEIAKTQRHKLIGNAVTVAVVKAISTKLNLTK